MKQHADRVVAVAISSDGRLVITADNPMSHPGVYLWRVETGEVGYHLGDRAARFSSLALSPDSRWLVGGSRYGVLYCWEVSALTN